MSKESNNYLLSRKQLIAMIVLAAYLLIPYFVDLMVPIKNVIIVSFIADVVTFIMLVTVYKKRIKQDYLDLKKYKDKSKIILTILVGIGIITIVCNLSAIVINNITGVPVASNYIANIKSIYSAFPAYYFIKVILFAGIGETIYGTVTLDDMFGHNKFLYVLMGTAMYVFGCALSYGDATSTLLISNYIYFAIIGLTLYLIKIALKNNYVIIVIISVLYLILATTCSLVLI